MSLDKQACLKRKNKCKDTVSFLNPNEAEAWAIYIKFMKYTGSCNTIFSACALISVD